MSREIKFRVWSQIAQKYLDVGETYISTSNGVIFRYVFGEPEFIAIEGVNQSDCILEQFTGLKDKNGKEIYAGDLIKSYNVDYDAIALIGYEKDIAAFVAIEEEGYACGKQAGDLLNQPGDPWMIYACEVIGNIHENERLIKK